MDFMKVKLRWFALHLSFTGIRLVYVHKCLFSPNVAMDSLITTVLSDRSVGTHQKWSRTVNLKAILIFAGSVPIRGRVSQLLSPSDSG